MLQTIDEMGKKVLIDLLKLRDLEDCKAEAFDRSIIGNRTFKTVRELATFYFTCRRCDDAPCINVCPADALEKDESGIVKRSLILCIRCKSCIMACPFGTIMNDLFETKISGYNYFDLSDEEEMNDFVAQFPSDVVTIVDMDENPEENIYKLTEKVLFKESAWEQ